MRVIADVRPQVEIAWDLWLVCRHAEPDPYGEFTMSSAITDRLLGLLGDPLFWIGTIFVGLLINVIGNYLTRFSDTFVAKASLRTVPGMTTLIRKSAIARLRTRYAASR